MILTEEQREMLKGKICPYCHIPTEYKNSIEVYGIDYGMISTAGCIATVFPMLLALIFQKYIVTGLTAGGVKD